MDIKGLTITGAISVATAVAPATWWASENLAKKDDVHVVALKADISLDKHIESLTKQAALIEAKGNNATRSELEQLRYLREEVKRLRETRQGK